MRTAPATTMAVPVTTPTARGISPQLPVAEAKTVAGNEAPSPAVAAMEADPVATPTAGGGGLQLPVAEAKAVADNEASSPFSVTAMEADTRKHGGHLC